MKNNTLIKKLFCACLTAVLMLTGTALTVPAEELTLPSKNLVINGGFEDLGEDGYPKDVRAYGNWGGDYVSLVTDEVHSGKNAVKIGTRSGGNPWCSVTVKDLVAGATYEVSVWYKAEVRSEGKGGFTVKCEQYGGGVMASDHAVGAMDGPICKTTGGWTKLTYSFVLPLGGDLVALYPRMYAEDGTVYVDDLELRMTAPPEIKFTIDTDQVFYYPDIETGRATVELTEFYKDNGYTVEYTIADGKTILAQKSAGFVNGVAAYEFPTKLMAEKKKEYMLTATVKEKNGDVAEVLTQPIYKYDRPTALGEDGVLRKNGEPVFPVVMYHANDKWDVMGGAGINVIQYSCKSTVEATLADLDRMEKAGVMAAVVCYWGMYPAGNDINYKRVGDMIRGIKDHPAIACWMVMDEPYVNNPDAHEDLRKSYIMIRDIDDKHPLYICEGFKHYYKHVLKYCDVMAPDPYPGVWNDYGTFVGDTTSEAKSIAEKYGKPLWNILQAFSFGSGENQKPTEDQLHSMMWQALLAGSSGLGYYTWIPDNYDVDQELDQSSYWPVMTAFNDLESEIALRHFTTQEHPTFNKSRKNDAWYETWTDGKVVYAAIQNRLKAEQTVTVPLTSQNGTVTINDFDISVVYGGLDSAVTKEAGAFSARMRPQQAVLYKIIPSVKTDFSSITKVSGVDEFPWAKEAIDALYAAGITHEKADANAFRPSDDITRGELAMYLIRTMGLKTTFTTSFADVAQDAPYAKEVGIGKELRILLGVGDNNYNPEAPISRQDLIVICARGMRFLKAMEEGKAETLSNFSDKDSIAAYAVEPVAAMIQTGIVTGNGDGTVNPLGNTTRAEAAVIMHRILEWKGA